MLQMEIKVNHTKSFPTNSFFLATKSYKVQNSQEPGSNLGLSIFLKETVFTLLTVWLSSSMSLFLILEANIISGLQKVIFQIIFAQIRSARQKIS